LQYHWHQTTMDMVLSGAHSLFTKRDTFEQNNLRTAPKTPKPSTNRIKPAKTVLRHEFVLKNFIQPAYCGHCSGFLWGINRQGMQCRLCHFTVHESCHRLVLFECAHHRLPSEKSVSHVAMAEHFQKPHQLKAHTYYVPTNCSHCGFLLYGLWHQGFHCSECSLNVHWKCSNFIPNFCGVFSLTEPIGRLLLHFQVYQLSSDRLLLICVLRRLILTCTSGGLRHPEETLTLERFLLPVVANKLGYDSEIVHSVKTDTETILYIAIAGAEPLHCRRLVLQLVQNGRGGQRRDILSAVSFSVRDLIDSPERASGWYRLLPVDVGRKQNERMPAPGQSWASIVKYLNTMP